jgi:hypothetical protein
VLGVASGNGWAALASVSQSARAAARIGGSNRGGDFVDVPRAICHDSIAACRVIQLEPGLGFPRTRVALSGSRRG